MQLASLGSDGDRYSTTQHSLRLSTVLVHWILGCRLCQSPLCTEATGSFDTLMLFLLCSRRAASSTKHSSLFHHVRCLATSSSSSPQPAHVSLDSTTVPPPLSYERPLPIQPHTITPRRRVPPHITKPSYATTGIVPIPMYTHVLLHDKASIARMRAAARLARRALEHVCSHVHVGVTTDELDEACHEYIISQDAYPSPLNYAGFPKSLCTSINEVICHGIPDLRPLEFGDVISLDVSCFYDGVHGDNCATVICGDEFCEGSETDWRGVPMKTEFDSPQEELRVKAARRLVQATQESLLAGIEACRPGGCLSHVGAAIHEVADAYGYDTVRKYRGHGISHDFHCPPFVKVKERSLRPRVCPNAPLNMFLLFCDSTFAIKTSWN